MHQSEPRIDTHGLLRELGLKEAIAIGLGTMIGAGILVLSALAAERAGPAAALSYALAGAVPDAVADRAPCSVLMVRRYERAGISAVRRVARSVKG
jgi:amino acid transporter